VYNKFVLLGMNDELGSWQILATIVTWQNRSAVVFGRARNDNHHSLVYYGHIDLSRLLCCAPTNALQHSDQELVAHCDGIEALDGYRALDCRP